MNELQNILKSLTDQIVALRTQHSAETSAAFVAIASLMATHPNPEQLRQEIAKYSSLMMLSGAQSQLPPEIKELAAQKFSDALKALTADIPSSD